MTTYDIPDFSSLKTMGDVGGPAMKITDQGHADAYLDAYIVNMMEEEGHSRAKADQIARENFAFYAGYWGKETRERVERLFNCAHPVFGSIADQGPPTAERAFALGVAAAEAVQS